MFSWSAAEVLGWWIIDSTFYIYFLKEMEKLHGINMKMKMFLLGEFNYLCYPALLVLKIKQLLRT